MYKNGMNTSVDKNKILYIKLVMDAKIELIALRDMRDIAFAIRDLENQQQAVAKRFRRGVRSLQTELAACEQAIEDEGITIEGTQPWQTRSDELIKLIADPTLSNVAEDLNV